MSYVEGRVIWMPDMPDSNPKERTAMFDAMNATLARLHSYDPAANIYAGVRYLRWLLKTFNGNADLAVAAYNAGEGNVWKYNGVPPFRETITYINRIAKHIRNAMTPAAATTTKVAAGAR